jgi:putative CocE/NonD family hydrolase
LVSPPAELVTAAITMSAHDMAFAGWSTGSYALADLFGWSLQIAEQEISGSVRRLINGITFLRRINRTMTALPLAEPGGSSVAGGAPWHRHWLEHPDPRGEYWDPARMTSALDSSSIPVLLVGGWQDVFADQTLEQYHRLRQRGVDVALVVGPWTHAQGGGDAVRESLAWLDEHLGGKPRRMSRVRIFVTGGADWRDLDDWPPASGEFVLYPGSGSVLVGAPPIEDESSSRFTYDPADPTPTEGGRLLFGNGGYRDDTRLATRPDVVAFTGQPLPEDLEVIGTPRVELAHSTDIPWADVFVRISEVDRKGHSHNVSDGYVRLNPERSPLLRLDMDAMAQRVRAGNRIRLIVAGGSFPRFARNLGTGEPAVTGTRLARCTHVVNHAGSRLILPVPGL